MSTCRDENLIGTKEYWDNVYKRDLQNFKDYGDEGDIWFGEANVKRISKWLSSNNINKSSTILDIGCGNGMLLIYLAELGFENLKGIDYVPEAIELAKNITNEKHVTIDFEVADFLCDTLTLPTNSCLQNKFKVIIDKGTYDAIGMCPLDGDGKRVKYKNRILELLDPDGIFILVSCNWTKDELLSHFSGLKYFEDIPTPSIAFGGNVGQTVTILILKRMVHSNDM